MLTSLQQGHCACSLLVVYIMEEWLSRQFAAGSQNPHQQRARYNGRHLTIITARSNGKSYTISGSMPHRRRSIDFASNARLLHLLVGCVLATSSRRAGDPAKPSCAGSAPV